MSRIVFSLMLAFLIMLAVSTLLSVLGCGPPTEFVVVEIDQALACSAPKSPIDGGGEIATCGFIGAVCCAGAVACPWPSTDYHVCVAGCCVACGQLNTTCCPAGTPGNLRADGCSDGICRSGVCLP